MSAIFISLRSEFYKFKRSPILISTAAFPLTLVALYVWGYSQHPWDDQAIKDAGAQISMIQWAQYISSIGGALSTFLVPMFTVFIAYSVNDIEHKSDMWKSLFALPLSKVSIYAGKYLFAIGLLLTTMLLFYVLSSAGLHFLSWKNPNKYFFDQYRHGDNNLVLYFFKFFLSSLGILGGQMTLSFLWKDFFKPMGIGLLGTIIGALWAVKKPETAFLFPYAQPARAAFINHVDIRQPDINLFMNSELFSSEIVMSLLYLFIFAVLGFFVVSKRNIK
ncbi:MULTISPECIES: ABC transporter permease [Chitinophagaceae]